MSDNSRSIAARDDPAPYGSAAARDPREIMTDPYPTEGLDMTNPIVAILIARRNELESMRLFALHHQSLDMVIYELGLRVNTMEEWIAKQPRAAR